MRASLLFLLALLAACHARTPANAPSAMPVDVPQFDADRIDLTFDWEHQPSDGIAPSAAPIKLTAPDGTGLVLASLEARAVLYGPLAFTELHLAFENEEPRVREGTFSIQLPEGAAVSRFAMKIAGGWQEGEVVEREAARIAYESFLHRRVDPAMLEKDSGNVFRARVFPILARQRKEIILSYSHELPRAGEPYRLGLRGLPAMGQLDVQLLVPSQKKAFVLHRTRVVPERDFVWTPAKGTGDAVRGGRYVIVRSAPAPVETPKTPLDSVAILLDSSASRTSGYKETIEKLDRALGVMGARVTKVACFDQEVVPLPTLAAAKTRKPAGASDLGAALDWAQTAGVKRALLVTDGVPSAGNTEPSQLTKSVLALKGAGVERIDAIAVGGRRDVSLLRALADAGVVIDGDTLSHDAIAHELGHAPRPQAKLAVANAVRTWTDASLVFAEIDERSAERGARGGPQGVSGGEGTRAIEPSTPLKVDFGRELVVEEAPAPLVERAVAQARIRELGKRPDRAAAKREIIDLSVKHRVLSDYTAMLVLETEADYARFKIPRDALAEILVVGSRGVVAAKRNDFVLLQSNNGKLSPLLDPKGPTIDPNADSDGDGIPDMLDKCPNEPETFNGIEDEDGCPDRGHVIIDSNQIVILRKIMFRTDSAEILPESFEMVDMIAQTLIHHPEFLVLEIAGHTDERGDDATNLQHAKQRAEAVVKALVDRKVPKDRLVPRGYGEWCPEDPGHNEEAWQRNRRVEFKIIATKDGPTGVETGCENAFQHGVPRPPGAPRPLRTTIERTPQRWKATPAGEPLSGPSAEIQALLLAKKNDAALEAAEAWAQRTPEDILAWIALGRVHEARGNEREAARAYGSVLDVGTKPEHRRAAAGFLEGLTTKWAAALPIALDTYKRAVLERPEHPTSHRLLAYALARSGLLDQALETVVFATVKTFDEQRAPGAKDILRRDAALFGAALVRARPTERAKVQALLEKANTKIAAQPSSSIVLTWETDESDLDLLLETKQSGANNSARTFEPVFRDLTLGYGPEAYVVDRSSLPLLKIEVQQARRGPQGFALGKVAIVHHDGAGKLAFEDRPFLLMTEGAAVQLGTVTSH